MDPRTPVVVGAGVASQRLDDPSAGVEAVELMRRALDAAASDAGAKGPGLLDRVDEIIVPEGIWAYRDPGRLVLDGRSPAARTVVADVGVLQQTMYSRAAAAIASGAAEVVVIVGGEAKYRALRAEISGTEIRETPSIDEPDVRLRPAMLPISDLEIHRGLGSPTHQYAVIESAIRHDLGVSPVFHAMAIGELVADLSRVAVANPDAWNRNAVTAADVMAAPLVAEPYTKPCCSQWNVDQAAAVMLCSAEVARSAGIASDRWLFPWVGAESNLMVPMVERAALHQLASARAVRTALIDAVGVAPDQVDLLELYSCFPAAIQLQCRELGIDDVFGARPLTVTGGMHFAGGPLNSFSLHGLARLVPMLREHAGSKALLTSVSGTVTKFGAGIWSATAPPGLFRDIDVTDADRALTATLAVDADHVGDAVISGYTVGHRGGEAVEAVVVANTATGKRCVAMSKDSAVVAALRNHEWCGRSVRVDGAALIGID